MAQTSPRSALRLQAKPSVTPHLAGQVYAYVKQELFELALLPGDQFSELSVVEALGVSRTPVRQALQQLAHEGFVQVTQRNGWSVTAFDFERFEQLYDLRIVLELAAVERLCHVSGLSQVPELQRLRATWQVPPAQRLPAGLAAAQLDEDFHCTIVAATNNREMAAVHREVTDKISLIRRLDFTSEARVGITYDEHAAILDAILRQRKEQAQTLLKAHIEISKAEVRNITLHRLHTARRRRSALLGDHVTY